MNYYPFHLGDYAAHTGHLDAMEDLAYRRMLDLYYLREAPLPGEPVEVARLIRMRPHAVEVEAVLREFFTRADDRWHQARCDEELERMQDKQAKARASAAASVNARRAKGEPSSNERAASVERTLSDRSADAELPTPTPTPTPTRVTPPDGGDAPRKRRAAVGVGRPDDVAEQVWADWLTLRKKKSAPVTATVIEGAREQARLAGMTLEAFLRAWCRRGSQGLDAAWLKPDERGQQAETTYQRTMRERMQQAAPEAARKDPSHPAHAAAFFNAIEVSARTVDQIR